MDIQVHQQTTKTTMKNHTKTAIISDPHLGCHGNSEQWHKISLDYGYWLRDKLIDMNISDIRFLGDFFDNRNEIGVQTLHAASKFIDIFNDFNITMITGNHDMFYKNRNDVHSIEVFSGRKNVRIINEIETETIAGTTVTYIPWGVDISKVPKCDVIMGHLELNGFYMMVGKPAEGKMDPKILLNASDLIFSGHFHLRDERKYENGKKVIYVGSPYQINWGEASNIPVVYVFDFETKQYEFFENVVSPRHINLDPEKLNKDLIKNNIVSISFTSETEEEQTKIKSMIFSESPLETKIAIRPKQLQVDDTKIAYNTNIDLLQMMYDFVDGLSLEDLSEAVKVKLKELYHDCNT